MTSTRQDLYARILAFINEASDSEQHRRQRDALILELLRWQAEQVPAYARLCQMQGVDVHRARRIEDFPAMPTDVMRYARVAAHEEHEDSHRFHTSGTTQKPGVHALRDTTLYEAAANRAAATLFTKQYSSTQPWRFLFLVPPPTIAPHSSLSFMLAGMRRWFGGGRALWAWHTEGRVDVDALCTALEEHRSSNQPVALIGTSFAFVHVEDALKSKQQFALPRGSLVMHTGGFKNRSRKLDRDQMRALLSQRYGVSPEHVLTEYGMTELSSQLYELPSALNRYWIPPWLRVSVVHPRTLKPVGTGQSGVLRFDDMANIDSVCSIQTADVGEIDDEAKLCLQGRLKHSPARGCSLAIDAWDQG